MCWLDPGNETGSGDKQERGEKAKQFCYSARALVSDEYCLPDSEAYLLPEAKDRVSEDFSRRIEHHPNFHRKCPGGKFIFPNMKKQL
jgi:hypothetical protein